MIVRTRRNRVPQRTTFHLYRRIRRVHLAAIGFLVADLGCTAGTPEIPERTVAAATAGGAASYEPVQILTWPAAQCVLQGANEVPIPVLADDRGVASFEAEPAQPTDAVTMLSLDCHDESGRTGAYPVDLTSAATFNSPVVAPPLPANRPGLTGNPLGYSLKDLLQAGYGLRPDPVKAPAAYARWLQDALAPAHRVMRTPVPLPGHGDNYVNSQQWSGGLFSGATFAAVWWGLTVPSIIASGPCSAAYLWGGLGGWNGDVSLIQDGIQFFTNRKSISYNATLEFWSGNGVGDSCYATECGVFSVNPGDVVQGEAWACDSQGNINAEGGYACYYVLDESTTPYTYVQCDTPSQQGCSSLADINQFLGPTSEGIMENNSPNNWCSSSAYFSDFNTAYIDILAQDVTGNIYEFGSCSDCLGGSNSTSITLVDPHGNALDGVNITSNPDPQTASFSWIRAQ